MTVQRLHPNLAAIDLISAGEVKDVFDSTMDRVLRDQFRTMKILDLPRVVVTASGATTLLNQGNNGQQMGPESGFVWRVGRITVASNGVDTGAVSVYAGSDFTNVSEQYLVDNTLIVGKAYYPGSRGLYLREGRFLYFSATTVANNIYTVSGQVVEVAAEMMGKIL